MFRGKGVGVPGYLENFLLRREIWTEIILHQVEKLLHQIEISRAFGVNSHGGWNPLLPVLTPQWRQSRHFGRVVLRRSGGKAATPSSASLRPNFTNAGILGRRRAAAPPYARMTAWSGGSARFAGHSLRSFRHASCARSPSPGATAPCGRGQHARSLLHGGSNFFLEPKNPENS